MEQEVPLENSPNICPDFRPSAEFSVTAAFRIVPTTNGAGAGGAARAALYLRVSTRADKGDDDAARQRKRQDVENQRRQLRQFCETQELADRSTARVQG